MEEHNYGFAMELHYEFTYRPGLFIDFLGDDDFWVFINDSLTVDLGGVYEMDSASFSLSGLEPGRRYKLDIFRAERHTMGSNTRITTDLLSTEMVRVSPDRNRRGAMVKEASRSNAPSWVFDLMGRLITPNRAHGGAHDDDPILRDLPAGVYFLKGRADGVAHEARIVAGD